MSLLLLKSFWTLTGALIYPIVLPNFVNSNISPGFLTVSKVSA